MAGSQRVHVAIIHMVVVPGLKEGVGCFVRYIDWISKYLALFEESD